MTTQTVSVIVNPEGKFLASAWFSPGKVRARWVEEYPDGAEYARGEAIRTARKLLDADIACNVIENYGLESEHVALGE